MHKHCRSVLWRHLWKIDKQFGSKWCLFPDWYLSKRIVWTTKDSIHAITSDEYRTNSKEKVVGRRRTEIICHWNPTCSIAERCFTYKSKSNKTLHCWKEYWIMHHLWIFLTFRSRSLSIAQEWSKFNLKSEAFPIIVIIIFVFANFRRISNVL